MGLVFSRLSNVGGLNSIMVGIQFVASYLRIS